MQPGEATEYRKELSEQLKAAKGEDRKEKLDKAKERPQYWHARDEKLKERQGEEPIEGDEHGVFVKNKMLYHGSGTHSIESFTDADAASLGSGLYLTSEAKDAIGYAHARKRDEGSIIYETMIQNMKFLDLRNQESVFWVMDSFKSLLEKKLETLSAANIKGDYPDAMKEMLHKSIKRTYEKAIKKIQDRTFRPDRLREIVLDCGVGLNTLFSDHIQSLGYDGLIAPDGEPPAVQNHDTYLVFDPKKVNKVQEHKIV